MRCFTPQPQSYRYLGALPTYQERLLNYYCIWSMAFYTSQYYRLEDITLQRTNLPGQVIATDEKLFCAHDTNARARIYRPECTLVLETAV